MCTERIPCFIFHVNFNNFALTSVSRSICAYSNHIIPTLFSNFKCLMFQTSEPMKKLRREKKKPLGKNEQKQTKCTHTNRSEKKGTQSAQRKIVTKMCNVCVCFECFLHRYRYLGVMNVSNMHKLHSHSQRWSKILPIYLNLTPQLFCGKRLPRCNT